MANRTSVVGRPFTHPPQKLAQIFEDYRQVTLAQHRGERIDSYRDPPPPTFAKATELSRSAVERHLRGYAMDFPLWPLETVGECPWFALLVQPRDGRHVLWASLTACRNIGRDGDREALVGQPLAAVIDGLDDASLDEARASADNRVPVPLAYLWHQDGHRVAAQLIVSFGPKNMAYWIVGQPLVNQDPRLGYQVQEVPQQRSADHSPAEFDQFDTTASYDQARRYAESLNLHGDLIVELKRSPKPSHFNAEPLRGAMQPILEYFLKHPLPAPPAEPNSDE